MPQNDPGISEKEVRGLFEASLFCPLCGSAELSRSAGSMACTPCGQRYYNNPVTAVAVFLFDEKGRLLLIRRAKAPALGKWAPPGGFVDAGETLEEAALREVFEETGVRIKDLRYLASFPNVYIYRGLARPVSDVFFTAQTAEVQVRLQAEEAGDFRFVPPPMMDPEELAFDSMRRAFALLSTPTGDPR